MSDNANICKLELENKMQNLDLKEVLNTIEGQVTLKFMADDVSWTPEQMQFEMQNNDCLKAEFITKLNNTKGGVE
jgi:hypothetical protein